MNVLFLFGEKMDIDNNNLLSVLEYIKKMDFLSDSDDWKHEWIRINPCTEVFFNTTCFRITINISIEYEDDNKEPDGIAFYLYYNEFIFVEYLNISPFAMTCESKKETRIRTDIETEGEFFQETCILDVLSMEYSNYKLIQEIRKLCSYFLRTD